MDFLSIGACVVAWLKDSGSCKKPLIEWYTINGVWACSSLLFMIWYTSKQLKNNYQTKRAIALTYVFESGYIVLSIWAWAILAKDDPDGVC